MRNSAIAILGAAAAIGGFAVLADAQTPTPATAVQQQTSLRPVAAFNTISDRSARSVALFEEAGKVIAHPRCANCHPVSTPAQGGDRHPHMPKVVFGVDGHGAVGLPCAACHTSKNVWVGGAQIVTVPGNPKWALAPKEMAWQGKSLGEICRQIKDPKRNGGKTLAQIHEHMAGDELVAWGWNPGAGRVAAPGTQAQFGEIIQAWIATGAACPTGGPVVPTHEAKTVVAAAS
jgi:hypothetical protein